MLLGRLDQIDKEEIRKLIVSLSRYLDTDAVPDGGRLGEARDFGLGYIAAELWRRFDLTRLFSRELKKRKFEAPVERAIFAMTVHRLVDPSPKLSCWDWLLGLVAERRAPRRLPRAQASASLPRHGFSRRLPRASGGGAVRFAAKLTTPLHWS